MSGEDLASRAAIQAQRLGARLNAPCEVAGLRIEHGVPRGGARRRQRDPVPHGHRRVGCPLSTARGRRPGAIRRRRRLLRRHRSRGAHLQRIGRHRGRRRQLRRPGRASTSRSRAAAFRSRSAASDLAKSMSHYLIERIEADPRIEVLTNTEVRALEGDRAPRARHVELTPTASGERFRASGSSASSAPIPRRSGSREWWRSTPAVSS